MTIGDTIWAIFDSFKVVVGVDPGSDHLRIIKGGEIIFDAKNQVVLNKIRDVVSGRNNSPSDDTVVFNPVDYAISDINAFEIFLRGALKMGINSKSFFSRSYKMYLAIPTSSTEIEKRAFRDAAQQSGVTDLYIIYQCYCSAIGMGLLATQKHFILIDFSRSKIEMAVFANSVAISIGTVRMGTSKIIQLLKNFFRREYKLEVSDREIDFLWHELRKPIDGVKIQFTTVKVAEILAVLNSVFAIVNDELIGTIERVSAHPDLTKAMAAGIYFTGGGSTIDFLRNQIKIGAGIKWVVSKHPRMDNINGLKNIMEDRNKFENYITV